jgi:mycothiol synthase
VASVIEIGPVESDADLEAWATLKSRIVPEEPVTADQLRSYHAPERILVLATLDGELAGCGVADRSHFPGRAFVAPRVLPEKRGRGVGTALFHHLVAYARELGVEGLTTFVDGDDAQSRDFAARRGLVEVDRQIEQVREVADEPPPQPPDGVTFESLGQRREELLREAFAVATEAYADMPLPDTITVPLEEWLNDEATLPAGSFVARAGGVVVGYAGLLERAESGTAEHGLTAVRRDWRGRGVGQALKRAELHWASANGLRQLVTWTQRGNEAMQTLNRRLGYVDRTIVLTMQGPLSGVGSTEPPSSGGGGFAGAGAGT